MRTWLEKILQTSLQMESKISIAQIINDMICVKVDKAPHSASSRRSQCPLARRPPTLRNSYITITSCTYHKIRSRASDLETSSSRTSSPLSHPLNPSSVTDADSATSTKCSIIHVNRSAQGRRRLMTMMTTSLRPRQGWTTFSSFIQKEAVPLSDSYFFGGRTFPFLHLVSLVTGVALVHAAASVSASMGSCADAGEETEGSSLLDSSSFFTLPPEVKDQLG